MKAKIVYDTLTNSFELQIIGVGGSPINRLHFNTMADALREAVWRADLVKTDLTIEINQKDIEGHEFAHRRATINETGEKLKGALNSALDMLKEANS